MQFTVIIYYNNYHFSLFLSLSAHRLSKPHFPSSKRHIQTMAFLFSSPKYTFLSSLLLLLLLSSSVAELSFNFYGGSCPGAELIIRNTVRSASASDPSVLGKLLRLIFHDCFVQVYILHSSKITSFLHNKALSNEMRFFVFIAVFRVVMPQY